MYYFIGTTFSLGILIGYLLSEPISRRERQKMHTAHKAEMNLAVDEAHKKGWDEALKDPSSVRNAYMDLFHPTPE